MIFDAVAIKQAFPNAPQLRGLHSPAFLRHPHRH
jgi:hypothetical protein